MFCKQRNTRHAQTNVLFRRTKSRCTDEGKSRSPLKLEEDKKFVVQQRSNAKYFVSELLGYVLNYNTLSTSE